VFLAFVWQSSLLWHCRLGHAHEGLYRKPLRGAGPKFFYRQRLDALPATQLDISNHFTLLYSLNSEYWSLYHSCCHILRVHYFIIESYCVLCEIVCFQTNFHDKTPYTIMFGPDKCGNDHKVSTTTALPFMVLFNAVTNDQWWDQLIIINRSMSDYNDNCSRANCSRIVDLTAAV